MYKSNKITLRKLNKTKEKLFRIYEETDIDDLSAVELYNYYKLYKIGVFGNTQNKLISLLKNGKSDKVIYHFTKIVYIEKCRKALEKEYSNDSSLNQNNLILKNEDSNDKDNITIYFQIMENIKKYSLRVSKNLQFIKVIHKLFTNYPELESKKIGTYVSNGAKIGLFDTIQENNLEQGSIILIINKYD